MSQIATDGWGNAPKLSRREQLSLACAVVLQLGLPVGVAHAQQRVRLVVYLHTAAKSHALEAALRRQMPTVEVTVCSRHRDFLDLLQTRPDAAVAAEPVLVEHGLPRDLRGVRGGQDSEPYVLLSVGTTVDRAQFTGMTFGAVDLLGRGRTGRVVASLLGLPNSPQVKYVIKAEDLLPLLQFRFANAALMPEAEAARIKSMSKLDLRVTPLGTRLGLASATFSSEAGRSLIRPALMSLDLETNRKLGVDGWR